MAETVIMPKLGFDMAEGTLVRWVIGEGQPVAKGQVLAEIETDKATVEVESTFEGIVAKHLVAQGAVVPVNTPIAIVAKPGETITAIEEPATAARTEAAQAVSIATPAQTVGVIPAVAAPSRVKASPLAKRLARQQGIDLSTVAGSGPGGRIVKRDVETYQATAIPPLAAPAAPSPTVVLGLVVPHSKLRAAIARRMVEAKQQTPHFYVTHEYDMAALMSLRKQVNSLLPDDEKISVNDFILKAVALTLRKFPNLNASFTSDGRSSGIVRHAEVNIGVAVAVEGGLLTVVCRNADQKALKHIANEVKALVGRAREGKVRPDDIEGSTFSISNLGMYDVEQFVAIINPPEAAILAVGSVKETPVVENGQLAVGLRMKATLSVDHRVSDGAEAAQFLQALAEYLEEPLRLLV